MIVRRKNIIISSTPLFRVTYNTEYRMSDGGLSPITRAKLDGSLDKVVAIGQLVSNPRWAKIWFSMDFLCGPGEGVTAQEVIDSTEIPQSTVYEDLDDMTDSGCVEVSSEGRPRKYQPVSIHVFVSEHPMDIGVEYQFTPNLIGVVGEAYEDEDVSLFLSRNSFTVLDALIGLVMKIISEEEDASSLVEYLDESARIEETDLRLIEPAIRRILAKQTKNPEFDWEGPEE